MEDRDDKIEGTIRKHMLWAIGAGFIPLPLADLFSVGAIQLNLIRRLCKIYDIDFREEEGKAVITSLTSSAMAKLGARTMVKMIPGIGSIVGGVTMSILSGASTYAVGQTFRIHFERGGTILDIDLGRLKKDYHDTFEKGKEEAAKYQQQKAGTGSQESEEGEPDEYLAEVIRKLKELKELRQENIITEEEYQRMKNKLLNDT